MNFNELCIRCACASLDENFLGYHVEINVNVRLRVKKTRQIVFRVKEDDDGAASDCF